MKPSTYCKNCGAYIPDGKKKCLACGFPVDVPSLYDDPNKVETTSFQETMPDRSVFKPYIRQSEQKKQESKPDIDLDNLMEKTFVTVKINDKVTRFYFNGRPQMCVADDEIFGRTMDGRIIGNGIKRKIDFHLIEA